MARKSRWSRYRPPAERRTEAGRPVDPPKPAPKPRPATAKPKPKQTTRPKDPARTAWVRAVVVLGVIAAIVVGIVLAVNAGDGGDDYRSSGDVELDLLDEAFIGDGLAGAAAEEPGRKPVAVHLDEYGMTVEYYDPTKDESRYVETNGYSDDRTIRVTENFYTDYKPQPFDLAVVEPAAMVRAVKAVLEDAEDPYSWEVRIRVEDGATTPTMVARASGKEDAERTEAP